jgi:hypothetical protein
LAALEHLKNSEDKNIGWENIKQNIKTSFKDSLALYELRQHKPRFDGKCLGFVDHRRTAKM